MPQMHTIDVFLAAPDSEKPKWRIRIYRSRSKEQFVDQQIEVFTTGALFCDNCGALPPLAINRSTGPANCPPCFKKLNTDAEFFKP